MNRMPYEKMAEQIKLIDPEFLYKKNHEELCELVGKAGALGKESDDLKYMIVKMRILTMKMLQSTSNNFFHDIRLFTIYYLLFTE